MDLRTAQRIDGLLANEVFPTYVHQSDFRNVIELKLRELETATRREDRNAINKIAFEVAAIAINFIECGLVSP